MERARSGYPVGTLLLTTLLLTSAIAFVSGGAMMRSGLILAASMLAITAIVTGLRVHRTADRLPWLLVVAGMSLLTILNLLGFVDAANGIARPDTVLNQLLQAGGYLAVLAAAVVVVMRHAPHDRGGVIDATLTGIGIAAPVWEFLLRPQLIADGASLSSQAVVLLQVLLLLAVLGALLRISRTTERGELSLTYVFAALSCTIVALVLSGVTTDPETGRQLPAVGVLWIWGYLFLGAAGLHPSAARFVLRASWRREAPRGIHLGYLCLVLLLNPIIGGVPQLFGEPPDGLLLCFGQLMAVPLVIIRIGQMMRQRTRDQQLLVEQARRDDLTGLANRRHLFALLDDAVRRHASGSGPAITLLFCDLDDFKPVNDHLGHDAGDHVLRIVGQRLNGCVRGDDVVGRIGGDEFVVMCPGAGPEQAARLGERIAHALAEPITWHGQPVRIGVTIGTAASGPSTPTGDALVAAADMDMYARKHAAKAARVVPAPPSGALAQRPSA